jgi:hypothetical protein
MDLFPQERQQIRESQDKASRGQLRSFSAKVSFAGGLFIVALIAYAAYKVNDSLTRNYLVFLLLMLGLVMVVALLLLALRPFFERFMNAAFDKLGLKETIDFKWTLRPVVTKAREVHDSCDLPPELANNPEVQKLLQSDRVQKLFQKSSTVTLNYPPISSGSKDASGTEVASDSAKPGFDSVSVAPEIRVFDSPANLPPELANNSQIKDLLARSSSSAVPSEKSAPLVGVLKWALVCLGFIILVLGFLTLFVYFQLPAR